MRALHISHLPQTLNVSVFCWTEALIIVCAEVVKPNAANRTIAKNDLIVFILIIIEIIEIIELLELLQMSIVIHLKNKIE